MTLLAARKRSLSVESRWPWWCAHWRVLAGILTAGVLLTLVTLLHIHVPGASTFSRPGYLGAVIVGCLLGGRWTAWLAVPAAALLADYYVTAPLHTFSLLWDPGDVAFLILTAVVAALAVIAARSITRPPMTPGVDVTHVVDHAPAVDVAQAVDKALREHADVEYWCAMYRKPGQEREQFALWKPGQTREVTAQLLADAAHGLPCDCDNCRALLAG